ncbi:Nuclear transport factor 2 [Neolecta irregularis DAH-3]|uniref:Nuclear transport factor 2 n=1 Tax=Neolecta irregularis (strain DAH-3) TaxID=1198029 RepID=A0A1U7LU41_NEOID|nr:Nuclear transport factor 2 [Neolecta irregularis DAH-3]|eukprot:OLL26195.1 Nuclear transport factor 2 [Neolecta irregularis DAH-3]
MTDLDFNAVAKQFTEFYYSQFDKDRSQLASLYRDTSMLTFQETQIQGSKGIIEKLVSLPFRKVSHTVTTLDAQPDTRGGVLVLVTGALMVDEEQNPLQYTQVFNLFNEGQSFFVQNDIFKLISL